MLTIKPNSVYPIDEKSIFTTNLTNKTSPGPGPGPDPPGPTPGPGPTPKPKPKSNTWWIVLLVVLSVLAIAGVVGWYIYKKRRGSHFTFKKDDDLISL